MHRLPMDLIQYLQLHNISYITQIADIENTSFLQQAWKTAHHLNIPPDWTQLWEDYTQALIDAHIRIFDGDDEIIWALSKKWTVLAKRRIFDTVGS